MIAEAVSALLDWRPKNATIENPRFSLQDPRTWDELMAGADTDAGIRITPTTALTLAPVWQAVATISGDIAVSTMNCYQEDDDDRSIDWDHEAQYLTAVQWNEETSAFEGWRRAALHACLWGNGYAYIQRQGQSSQGKMEALLNLLPDRTKPLRNKDGTLYYVTEVDGDLEPMRADEVIHLKGLSLDTSKGLDLVEKARNSWGLALAAEGFESKFFKNGTQAGGVLEIPATFSEKAKHVLEEGFNKKTAGKDNWFKTVILRDGAKFHQTTIDAQKSQTHELREDQVRDVARFFNMPPSKLGIADSVSYNSFEQSQIAYRTSCLNHWFASIDGECDIKLLRENERKSRKYFFEHNYSKLLDVDAKSLADVLNVLVCAEIINPNEARKKLNMNRRTDEGGDEYQNPSTKPAPGAEGDGEKPAPAEPAKVPPKKPKPKKTDEGSDNSVRELFVGTASRISKRICDDVRAYSKKASKFQGWVDSIAKEHRHVYSDAMLPVIKIANLSQSESLCVATEAVFFHSMLSGLSPFIEPPYSATDLEANVLTFCESFQTTIGEQLSNIVFPKENPNVQSSTD